MVCGQSEDDTLKPGDFPGMAVYQESSLAILSSTETPQGKTKVFCIQILSAPDPGSQQSVSPGAICNRLLTDPTQMLHSQTS